MTAECQLGIALWKYLASPCRRIVLQHDNESLTVYTFQEKWTLLCPQLSTGDADTYCVLLVYKAKPIGAYLLEKPSGEVSGLVTAAKTAAEAADVEIEYLAD